ncbi:transglutaminase family protein [Jannaschia sp. W003]|uniref:transglutaminase-like domain-containing protein n=1 Tax=Jannaschia sp. W003 TaxID=2867012 RepID=UPI0021A2F2B2|nr:transglutaminase family protein [Jannaschia sp. W003]UWQ22548.1 transglutaminase family protein [Jannaschia sp. W003]
MTQLRITTRLDYHFPQPSDCLLQVEVAHGPGQRIVSESLSTTPVDDFRRVPAESGLGTRAWFGAEGSWQATYEAEVEVTRPGVDLAALPATPSRLLPGDATSYLMPSRYCQSDVFLPFMASEFADHRGGALAEAIRAWVHESMSYVSGTSDATTTAADSFMARQGVCRDYAHVVIAMARAGGIPARMASVYAPDVDPPDLHAVAELWLDGLWRLVDATGMADPSEMAVIGVGRDAAEISFMTVMGAAELRSQEVEVVRA